MPLPNNLSVRRKIMTKLLEKALSEAAKLPKKDQDAIAAIILDEITANRRWETTFNQTGDVLSSLAEEALEEYKAGNTHPLDPDTL
jgi:predicted amidophosphoribosyltransferase